MHLDDNNRLSIFNASGSLSRDVSWEYIAKLQGAWLYIDRYRRTNYGITIAYLPYQWRLRI